MQKDHSTCNIGQSYMCMQKQQSFKMHEAKSDGAERRHSWGSISHYQ